MALLEKFALAPYCQNVALAHRLQHFGMFIFYEK
jgi:hypothetical protein